MFVGRNFWKSSLLESEKSEISLSSSNAKTSLIDLNIYSKYDVQRENFINVETVFIYAKNIFDYCEI